MELTNLICSLIGLTWALVLVGLALTRIPVRPLARTVVKRNVRSRYSERTLR
ncbi:MAG: hypothetical protein V1797_20735 [Pseudomonadota bacterium]